MNSKLIATGVAHSVPDDLAKALVANKFVLEKWQSLTPLARNEWICWVISNKKAETRQNHINRILKELPEGKRRPCCWMGCIHRQDKPLSPSMKWLQSKQSKK